MSETPKAVLAGLGIFVIGTAILISGILIADRGGAGSRVSTPPVAAAMPMSAGASANVSGSPAPAQATGNPAAATKLRIVHVAKGCHTFMLGNVEAPVMKLHLQRGQMLDLTNMDVDIQKLMQVEGPKMMLEGAMMQMSGGQMSMTFPTAGTYSFNLAQPPMPGAADEETDPSNPDNTLTLSVDAV